MPRPTGTIGETKLKILAIVCFNDSRGTNTYGYDVWKVLKEGFHTYFDEGNLRNVYRHLKDLEKLGLISRGPQQTIKGVPRRQPYSLTEKGREIKPKFTRYIELLSNRIKIVG
ncbi:MAG: helix-turn-helix transcriptional regulator [Candidatus Bathyarchaeota archaeon]|nr:helix-turn-helix transcriptional regulator [Candidatus Bathyarchaeota archaeon]